MFYCGLAPQPAWTEGKVTWKEVIVSKECQLNALNEWKVPELLKRCVFLRTADKDSWNITSMGNSRMKTGKWTDIPKKYVSITISGLAHKLFYKISTLYFKKKHEIERI